MALMNYVAEAELTCHTAHKTLTFLSFQKVTPGLQSTTMFQCGAVLMEGSLT